mgnify:CR=1 FL=1
MARNKKVEILSNDKEVLHPMTDGDCVIFEDGQTLAQKLSEDDSVKYTPEIVNSSPMFKVGEGNTVDYSDNVLDGAYERATLQGQTYVNYIQESSADEVTLPTPFTEYERTQHNTLTSDEEGTLGINLVGQSYVNALQHDSEEEFVVLGESLEFQEKKVEYTNEGQIKSAMLKGQTLVNLISPLAVPQGDFREQITINGLDASMSSPQYRIRHGISTYVLSKGKTYLIYFELLSESGNNSRINMYGLTETNTEEYFTTPRPQLGVNMFTFTPMNDLTKVGLYVPKDMDYQATISKMMVIEYQEGMENWDIPYFEGMQSVTVSTRLENLCHRQNSSTAKNGKTFNTNSLDDRIIVLNGVINGGATSYGMKPNTKYLVQFKVSNLVLDGLSALTLTFSTSTVDTGNCLFAPGTVENLVTSNGVYRVVLTTSNLISTSSVEIKGIPSQWENSGSSLRSMTISEIMYVEYQNGMENWNLPYFEDYQVMKPVQVKTTNRNLFDTSKNNKSYHCDMVAHNSSSFTLTGTGTAQYKNAPFEIDVKPNTDYYIQASSEVVSGNPNPTFDIYSMDNKYLYGGQVTKFNSGDNTRLSFRFYVNTSNTNTGSVKYTVQLEESSTATSYIPHQSKTTYSWDEVILRKVGDVEDTLDLTTGEWVQRIGEIKLIDQKSIGSGSKTSETWFEALVYLDDYIKVADNGITKIISNKLPLIGDTSLATTSYLRNNAGAKNYIVVALTVEDMGGLTGYDGWHYYVKNNDVVIQYVLETPIVHKVNLSRPNLQVYDDITHVHTKCLDGTLIPNIYLPSDVSYPAILEPGKKYNVCVNHAEVSADNPLKVNVGGTEITMTDSRMTLTTPATLANSNVSFTGKGNKIKESMLIKNSSLLTRDLPHFNGIGSVQLGKTIENLCEALSYGVGTATFTEVQYNDKIVVTVTKQGSLVYAFKLTRQLENGKQYYVYVPNTYPTNYRGIVGFRKMYNGTLTFAAGAPSDGVQKSSIIEINQTDNPYTHLTFGRHGGDLPVNTVIELQRPIICEYEPGMENWDWESIGYFTGTKNIGNEFMRVQNKNLFTSKNLILGANQYWASEEYIINAGHTLRATLSQLIQVTPGCTLTLTFGSNYQGVIQEYISGDKRTHYTDNGWYNDIHTLKLNEKTKYVNIYFRKKDDTQFTTDELNALKDSIQLEESSTGTTYTAQKYNGLYVTKDQPINLTWEQGRINPSGIGDSYTNAINNAVSYGIRTKGLLNLKPNTTYRISLGDKASFKYHIAVFDNWDNALPSVASLSLSGDWISSVDTIFTTTKDAHKIGINVQKQDVSSITPPESVHAQVRLEEVTDVVLRGIGDVRDELDVTRGIYTQRIGEVVFDGSENLIWSNSIDGGALTDVTCFGVSYATMTLPLGVHNVAISNNFKNEYGRNNYEHFYYEQKENKWAICVFVENKKLDTSLSYIDAFKKYLSENPNIYCVVSGGKGSDEEISEAECMCHYLVEKGITSNRIITESHSVNTKENILNSAKIIKATDNHNILLISYF